MDADDVLEKVVLHELTDVLGRGLAETALGHACAGAPRDLNETDRAHFVRVITRLCQDQDLVKTLGPLRLATLERHWLSVFSGQN